MWAQYRAHMSIQSYKTLGCVFAWMLKNVKQAMCWSLGIIELV